MRTRGAKLEHTCRHGFHCFVSLAVWCRRRRGKALRNASLVVKQASHGMQGRVLNFQEHPFECQSNYAASAAMRCNFDAQDLRRVLPEEHWLAEGEDLPRLGGRPHRGYMNVYEWNAENYTPRRGEGKAVVWVTGAATMGSGIN